MTNERLYNIKQVVETMKYYGKLSQHYFELINSRVNNLSAKDLKNLISNTEKILNIYELKVPKNIREKLHKKDFHSLEECIRNNIKIRKDDLKEFYKI